MKAAVLQADRTFAAQQVPKPEPKDNQVLVRVISCGICGSDVHIRKFERTPAGVTPGHEWVGTVEAVGKDVKEGPKVGDRVVMYGYSGGGGGLGPEMLAAFLENPMSVFIHHPVITAGGFGEYLVWDADRVHVVPPHVTDDQAALVDTFAVGVGAVDFAGVQSGNTVLIIGAGPIGLAALRSAKVAGASKVFVSEPMAHRRDIALSMGADAVLDPSKEDVRLPAMMQTGGGADVVLDCVGSPQTIQQAVDMAKMGGTVGIVGLTFDKAEITPLVWLSKSIRVCATMQGNSTKALAMIADGSLDTSGFITGRVGLDEIQKGFEMAEDAQHHIKVLVCAQ